MTKVCGHSRLIVLKAKTKSDQKPPWWRKISPDSSSPQLAECFSIFQVVTFVFQPESFGSL